MARKEAIDFESENDSILSALDVIEEYKSLGVRFPNSRVKSNGVCECFAAGRDERNPSAGVNASTGRYFDLATGEGYSLWDFAVRYGGRFADWRDARKYYAEKAGVSLEANRESKKDNGRDQDDRLDSIRWLDWNPGRETIAKIWGKTLKKGITLDAIKLAGGRFGEFPIRRDKETGIETGGDFKVIAIPGFDAERIPSGEAAIRPSCWVIWNATGPGFPRRAGRGSEVEILKMRSVGSTRGTLMNVHAIDRMRSGAKADLIIKTGGPTDMLAVLSCVPPEWRDRILVTANASGEVGEVTSFQTELMSAAPVVVIGDRDHAGSVGAFKWLQATRGERRSVVLPYSLAQKHGKDARDFLNGVLE